MITVSKFNTHLCSLPTASIASDDDHWILIDRLHDSRTHRVHRQLLPFFYAVLVTRIRRVLFLTLLGIHQGIKIIFMA